MKKSRLFDFNQNARINIRGDWLRRLGVVALMMMQYVLNASSSLAGQAKLGWEMDWEKTVAAARQEGQVNIYGATLIHEIAETGAFQKAYPGIKVVRGGGPPAGPAFQRLAAERRAGKYLADVYMAGVTSALLLHRMKALDPIKPLLVLPEVVDESKWWRGHHYTDPEQRYIFASTADPGYGSISYNTNLVNVKEIKSFWDILHPKWKGKIASRDIRTPGVGSVNNIFFYHNPQLGPKFLRRLYGEMDITLFRDARQAVNWLANGKFALCFFCSDWEVAKKQGLPVDEFGLLKEGAFVHAVGSAVNFVNRAPNPNAAKVFINWLLSREGQLLAQSVPSHRNSRRIDIPKDMLPESARLIEGVQYLDGDNPELSDIRPIVKLFEEVLAEAEKRKRGQ